MPASTDLDDITFLGRLSEALSDRIEEQTRPLFDEAGIIVPVRSCSLLTALGARARSASRTSWSSRNVLRCSASA